MDFVATVANSAILSIYENVKNQMLGATLEIPKVATVAILRAWTNSAKSSLASRTSDYES